jgi:hypothetical protein
VNECIFFCTKCKNPVQARPVFFTMPISPQANVGVGGGGGGVAEAKIYLFSPSRMVDGQGKFMY